MALDVDPAHATPFIEAAAPSHPSLIDTRHITGELFGFVNIPMAVWIDEDGRIVRNAEAASIEPSPFREMVIADELPERLRRTLTEVRKLPDDALAYRAAILDWVDRGPSSPFALTEAEVIERSQPRGTEQAEAAACFALGEHHRRHGNEAAAVQWWRRAHRLDPDNWTYKRQAWTLVTTPADAPFNDLLQGPNDTYDGNWLDDVIAAGGGDHYMIRPVL